MVNETRGQWTDAFDNPDAAALRVAAEREHDTAGWTIMSPASAPRLEMQSNHRVAVRLILFDQLEIMGSDGVPAITIDLAARTVSVIPELSLTESARLFWDAVNLMAELCRPAPSIPDPVALPRALPDCPCPYHAAGMACPYGAGRSVCTNMRLNVPGPRRPAG